MKIAILSTSFPRFKGDYIANFFLEIASRLSKENKVDVICPHAQGLEKHSKIEDVNIKRFVYLPPKYEKLAYGDGMAINIYKSFLHKISVLPFIFSFLINSRKLIKKSDVIIANFIPSALVGLFWRKIYHKPVILTVHRLVEKKGILGKLNKFIYENVDFVIFNSSYTQKEALNFINPKRNKIIFVGIETKRFESQIKKYDSKQTLELISVGRLIEKKGFKYLIDSVVKINKKYPKKIELKIIGWGDLENKLKKQIIKNKLNNIFLLGGKKPSEIPNYLNQAHIFVLPSIIDSQGETETLGVVSMEAMASGLPVIASSVGGIVDVVDNEVGDLVPEKDSDAIAAKIIKYLENPELVEIKSKCALKKAKTKFDWDILAKEYLEICYKISKF